MRSLLLPISLLLATSLVSVSCGDDAEAANARKEIGEATSATGELFRKRFRDFNRELADGWDGLRSELSELRDRAAEKGDQVKDATRETLSNAAEGLADARARVSRAIDAGSDDLAAAWANLEQAMRDARAAASAAEDDLGSESR